MDSNKLFLFVLLLSNILLGKSATNTIVPFQNFDSRIVNGEQASLGQFPWQVIMFLSSYVSVTTWSCGGTIISEEWIVTAGHCIQDSFVAHVSMGMIDYWDTGRTQIVSNEFIVHEGFNQSSLVNDIGLVRLFLSLTFTDYVSPIALASEPLASGVEILVSGYGQLTDDPDRNSFLWYTNLTSIENLECGAIYGQNIIGEEMFCALSPITDLKNTCFGDSGGPAIVYDGDVPTLVGVITFISARGCEYGDPAGFSRIASYRDWIRENSGV